MNLIPGHKNFWIVLSIYLSIFINSYVFFKEPFEFYLGYLVYILLLPGFIARYQVNKNLVLIFLTLLITGLINIALGNNNSALFLKVFVGLSLSYFFYYYIIIDFDFKVELLFKWYMQGCYIAALFGIFQFISYQISFSPGYNFSYILNKWGFVPGGFFGIRINSIFAEPTHLGVVLSAAFFVSVFNLLRKTTYFISRFKSAIIVIVYLLSFSGLGQTGILFSIILLAISFGFVRYVAIALPAFLMLFNALYNNVDEFRERYDGLVGLFTGEQFVLGKTHGSSFILYNNYIVAKENFKGNFLFGTGIGSHPIAFQKYSIAKAIKTKGFDQNSADANSMLLRLISETGLFGVCIFLYIVIRHYVRRDANYPSHHWLISNAILVMILLSLFRQGHYFLNGFPFFVILYYFNSLAYANYLQSQAYLHPGQSEANQPEDVEALPAP